MNGNRRHFYQRFAFLLGVTLLATTPVFAGVNRWTSIGPEGAAVQALAIDPSSPLTVYAGTAGGGVLKSTNGGVSSTAANDGLTNLFVNALAIHPHSPSTLYAGTGYLGGRPGVFRSINGGTSWIAVNNGLPDGSVRALAIDPNTASTVYAGSYWGLFKSINGGDSWTSSLGCCGITAIAIDPTSPSTVYVGSDWADGAYKSTDGGATWVKIPVVYTDEDVHFLAVDPNSPSTVYAGTTFGGVLKSTDAGASFIPINNGLPSGLSNLGPSALAIDPSAPSTLYVGTRGRGVFRSTNGGTSWAATDGALTNLNVYALAIDPTSPSTLYSGAGTGAFKSTDRAASWEALSIGLRNVSILALAVDPTSPSTLYASAGGGLVKSSNDGASWAPANIGLSFSVNRLAVNPSSPSTLYAGTLGGGIFKSTDGAATWTSANTGLGTFLIDALAIAPTLPSTLYAAGAFRGVFKSTNGGSSWTAVNNGLTNVGHYVSALAVDPTSASTVYVGTPATSVPDSDSKIFKTTNGGTSWTELNIALPSRANVTVLAIDPRNSSTVYAMTEGNGGLLLKSTNAGASWTAVKNDLAKVGLSVSALTIDPSSPSTMYANTDGRGVFRSTDWGTSWTPFNVGLTSLRISALVMDGTGKRLHVGTVGGGVFDYQIPSSFPCTPGADDLCLVGNRFKVILQATDTRTGRTGIGQAIAQGDRFGYFSLPSFTGDPTFPEVFVKMVDAASLPAPYGGSFWLFYNGLTDLRYTMTVIDTVTGQVKSYENDPANPMCGGADTSAFQNVGASSVLLTGQAAATSLAAASGIELALLGNRFRVTMTAVDPRTGNTGVGQAMPQGDRFGYFSLPDFTRDPAFPEVFVKMADATSSSGGSFWVFHAGLTDLQYTINVTDTVTGAVKIYQNSRAGSAHLCGGADTEAFRR